MHATQGVLVSSFVLLLELFPTPYQLQVSLFFLAFGLVCSMLLPLLMWIIKSWRYVQLAVSAPGVVFLAHVWFVEYSWVYRDNKCRYNLCDQHTKHKRYFFIQDLDILVFIPLFLSASLALKHIWTFTDISQVTTPVSPLVNIWRKDVGCRELNRRVGQSKWKDILPAFL